MAGVGLIESLLTLNIIDEITETRGRSNKEAVAQGIANVTSGFFSGMGGCAMLGQSLINISSGARARLCGRSDAFGVYYFWFWSDRAGSYGRIDWPDDHGCNRNF